MTWSQRTPQRSCRCGFWPNKDQYRIADQGICSFTACSSPYIYSIHSNFFFSNSFVLQIWDLKSNLSVMLTLCVCILCIESLETSTNERCPYCSSALGKEKYLEIWMLWAHFGVCWSLQRDSLSVFQVDLVIRLIHMITRGSGVLLPTLWIIRFS